MAALVFWHLRRTPRDTELLRPSVQAPRRWPKSSDEQIQILRKP
jgi:hypothetical protein